MENVWSIFNFLYTIPCSSKKYSVLPHFLNLHLVAISGICASCCYNCFTFVMSRLHLKDEASDYLECASVLCEGRSSRSFSMIRYLIPLISNSLLGCWLISTSHTFSYFASKIDLSYSLPGSWGSLTSYKPKVFSLERFLLRYCLFLWFVQSLWRVWLDIFLWPIINFVIQMCISGMITCDLTWASIK